MYVMLPLTKGHLSNKDRIVWQEWCPCQRGATVCILNHLTVVEAMVQIFSHWEYITVVTSVWASYRNYWKGMYSSPPVIRTSLLPNSPVLIREVSFGEREHCILLVFPVVATKNVCPFWMGVFPRERPLYIVTSNISYIQENRWQLSVPRQTLCHQSKLWSFSEARQLLVTVRANSGYVSALYLIV